MKLRRFHENKSEYFEEFCRIIVQFVNIESGNQNILRTLSTREFKLMSIQCLSPKKLLLHIGDFWCCYVSNARKN